MVFFMQKKPPISAPIPAAAAPARTVPQDAARSCTPVATVTGPVKSDPWIRSCDEPFPVIRRKISRCRSLLTYAMLPLMNLFYTNLIQSEALVLLISILRLVLQLVCCIKLSLGIFTHVTNVTLGFM